MKFCDNCVEKHSRRRGGDNTHETSSPSYPEPRGRGGLESVPKLALLPGEHHRERVVTPDEELRYLGAATALLADVAMVLVDTAMRPDECHRLRWEEITWVNGRNGSVLVEHGKTAATRRVLPMTLRVRATLGALGRAD